MAKEPKHRYVVLGKSKFVHVVHTELYDRKHSQCQMVRKATVAGKVPGGGMSPEAASALEPCPNCDTKRYVNIDLTSKKTAEDRKAEADATREKIRRESMTDGQRRKADKKAAAKERAAKPKKERRASKPSKSGPRSIGGSTEEKAAALGDFAKENGWIVTQFDAKPGIRLVAKRGDETITCHFVDGKYDVGRHATLSVGTWTGKLRGVHGCRKQMAGEGRDRPHPNPGHGRSGPRKKHDDDEVSHDESPEDAARRVPFLLDDEAVDILEKVRGQIIRWRNGVSGQIEEAWLPSKVAGKKRPLISVTEHPKSGKRMLNFLTVVAVTEDGEQYGPERSVYLDKIVRVVAA